MADTSPPRLLGERVFGDADQQRFAADSRDLNPIHVDPVAARRLISGRQLVHGVHTLIQALDLWPAPDDTYAGAPAVQCGFVHPVSVGDRVAFAALPEWRGRQRLAARVDGVAAVEIVLGAAPAPVRPAAPIDWSGPCRALGALAAPLDEPAEGWVGQCVAIDTGPDTLAQQYPRAAARFGAAALSDLARLSFFVGMVCPGLHSVFQSLQFELAAERGPLCVKVLDYDARYRLFYVAFRGALQGELRAVRRPPPQAQPQAAELAGAVAEGSWIGQRVLVIGGSRGLGEATAKLLAAAGADVTITYASGRDDALAVAADIGTLARGRCATAALDLSQPFAPPPGLEPGAFDAVFFFATPRIHAQRAALFQRAAFDTFASFYLERLHELCLWLEGGGRRVRVYLPSSTFIDERPRGMAEYAMAKAAAEVLADELNRTLRHVRVVHTRLPRLATDQTALLGQLTVADNVAALRGVLDAMRPE